jgi:hypothetical protein
LTDALLLKNTAEKMLMPNKISIAEIIYFSVVRGARVKIMARQYQLDGNKNPTHGRVRSLM